MEITDTIAPKSDQLNADDLRSGPRTFTVTEVRITSDAQPVEVFVAEWDQPWKPCKTMRRVMTELWGAKSATYAGRQFTLYRDAKVRFGNDVLGGLRISHMSDIGDKQCRVPLIVGKGKRGYWTVEPLHNAAPSSPASPAISLALLADLVDTFKRKGIPEDAWLSGANQVTGGSATDLETITETEALRVLEALKGRPDVEEPS